MANAHQKTSTQFTTHSQEPRIQLGGKLILEELGQFGQLALFQLHWEKNMNYLTEHWAKPKGSSWDGTKGSRNPGPICDSAQEHGQTEP